MSMTFFQGLRVMPLDKQCLGPKCFQLGWTFINDFQHDAHYSPFCSTWGPIVFSHFHISPYVSFLMCWGLSVSLRTICAAIRNYYSNF